MKLETQGKQRHQSMAKDEKQTGINRNLTQYGDKDFSRFIRRAFLSSAGYDPEDLARPVVGIVDTTSDYNTCQRQMPEMVAAVCKFRVT